MVTAPDSHKQGKKCLHLAVHDILRNEVVSTFLRLPMENIAIH